MTVGGGLVNKINLGGNSVQKINLGGGLVNEINLGGGLVNCRINYFVIFSSSAPNFEKTLIVAIKHGGTAEAAIGGMNKTIDSIISRTLFLVVKWSP